MNLNEEDFIFDSVILTDTGVTDSDENTEESENLTKTNKYARTTKEQFERLLSYKETHEDFVQGKASARQQLEWDAFIEELNTIGPPCRTSEEWRVVWTNRKTSQKRRLMSQEESKAKIPCKVPSTFKSFNTAYLALEINSGRLSLDEDSAHSALDSSSACTSLHNENLIEYESNTVKVTECDDGYLVMENDSSRSALHQDPAQLFLDADSNHQKVKISYVEEDKENFHAKVLDKLDVLIKQQQQSNENFAELIDVIKKIFC